jgi:hypothetical protein
MQNTENKAVYTCFKGNNQVTGISYYETIYNSDVYSYIGKNFDECTEEEKQEIYEFFDTI